MVGRLLLSLFTCILSPRQVHGMAQDESLPNNNGMRLLEEGATEFGILLYPNQANVRYTVTYLMPILHDFTDLRLSLFFKLWSVNEANCVKGGKDHDEKMSCSEICTNEGRYCTSGSHWDAQGRPVIEDILDQACLWELYAYSDDISPLQSYLNAQLMEQKENMAYGITTAVARCLENEDREKALSCRHDILTAASVNMDALETCIVSSGGLDTGPNSVLERSMNGTIDTMPHYVRRSSNYSLQEALCEQSGENAPYICTTCHKDKCEHQDLCWHYLSCLDDICPQCDDDRVCWQQGICPSDDDVPEGRNLGVTFVAAVGMTVAFLLMAMLGRLQLRRRNQPSYKAVDVARKELELT